jgi:hypothetical protein
LFTKADVEKKHYKNRTRLRKKLALFFIMKFGEGGGQHVWHDPVNRAAHSSNMKGWKAGEGFRN